VIPLWFWTWIVIALVCALYELSGAGMLSLPFALGALAAAVAALVGASIVWQWALFFGITLGGLVGFQRWWKAPHA
jgi:membrane protein implicated in regulation of membrane protease activity